MRVLITGGFGYLGGRLAQHLKALGWEVLLGTSRQRESPPWICGSEVIQIDWNSVRSLDQGCRAVDAVLHTAGANSAYCERNPSIALQVNGVNTARLVEAAVRQKVGKFVYLSTAHVYASPLEGTITEASPTQNLHPYATSHLAGESSVRYARSSGELDGLVLRVSNAFGYPTHSEVACWHLVLNDLCRQAVTTGRMTIRGDGSEKRDFIPISDVCANVAYLLQQRPGMVSPEIVNIGAGITHSVFEGALAVQERVRLATGTLPRIDRTRTSGSPMVSEFRYTSVTLKSDVERGKLRFLAELDQLIEHCNHNHPHAS
jgi:UDP-glucose 4-epimerase